MLLFILVGIQRQNLNAMFSDLIQQYSALNELGYFSSRKGTTENGMRK